jgi:integrase/recombinase XerD
MTLLAPTLQAFFTQRLITQRNSSPNTIAGYRDTFRLLLGFTQQQTNKAPSELDFNDLDAPLIGAFLTHLEVDRHNSIRTRNVRLAGIRSLFKFAAVNHPEHAGVIARVLAIGQKRFDRAIVEFLTESEADALFGAPDRNTWTGRRDHALLVLMAQTGLRVSEMTALTNQDVQLGVGAHVKVVNGKGRKQRSTPLTPTTVAILHVWMAEQQGNLDDALFPSRQSKWLSRDSVEHLVGKHSAFAAQQCPSLLSKRVTPHVLRHTSAMRLLQAGVDTTVIALWLGHESVETTQIYLHADMTIKERAIARTKPPDVVAGRYQAPDSLLTFLDGL